MLTESQPLIVVMCTAFKDIEINFTYLPQPRMYQVIERHDPVVELYARSLIDGGVVTLEEYNVRVSVCVCVQLSALLFTIG